MNKFEFDLQFQEEGLRFILNNPDGYLAMKVIKSSYFSLLEHSIIFEAIKILHDNTGRIPSKPILRNSLMDLFSTRSYQGALTQEDEKNILDNVVEKLYGSPAKDGDLLLQGFYRFAAYVELQSINQETNFEDFNAYPTYAKKVMEIVSLGDTANLRKQGAFLIADIKERQMKRQAQELVVPSPYHQLNALTSAGGYEPGSILVLLDKPKKLKTAFLVNTARKYMASKKKVLYVDFENGEASILARLEQSVGKVTKKDIIKGTKDKEIQKILRRYRRLGGEVYVRRLPAFSTTHEIQAILDEKYRKEGILFGVIMIDYLALMGSTTNKRDDFERISDAYLDVANLMQKNPSIVHCWTANHVQRTAWKKESSRYGDHDIAKCIDIIRHAHGIFGLNRTFVEFENDIVRLEIVSQREGVPSGRAYFRAFPEMQRIDELTRKEVEELEAQGILYNPDERGEQEEPEPEDRRRGDV